jgi:protein-disulfide isomerase
MRSMLRLLLIAGALSVAFGLPSPAPAAEFNDAQREELGGIIREYLLKHPEILKEAFQELERRSQAAEAEAAKTAISQKAAEIYRAAGDLVAGNPDGKITMVEFFDYNCG